MNAKTKTLTTFNECDFEEWATATVAKRDHFFAEKAGTEGTTIAEYCSNMELVCLLGSYLTKEETSDE